MIDDATIDLIHARLLLAQKLLEESDRLGGFSGYNHGNDKWWLHPRHERESVVIYLLLTCFDLLGQDGGFVTFENWLDAKSKKYVDEKNQVLKDASLAPTDYVGAAKILHSHYLKLYGVKGSFNQGILGLEPQIRDRFLKSVNVSFNPDYGKYGPNTSTPGYELEDKDLELKLKLKRIYGKRNKFTHKLDQYHRASNPMMGNFCVENGSSWPVFIDKGRLSYLSGHQEIEEVKTGGVYSYDFSDWPFVLFETLYAAIGVPFDRSDIDLKFHVQIHDDSSVTVLNGIDHKLLKPLAEAIHLERIKDK